MKDKNTAALLGLFLGCFGIHRFYLGQVGLGIFYCFLSLISLTGIGVILGVIDFIAFLTMDEETFDRKYNRDFFNNQGRGRRAYDTDFERDRRYDRRDERRAYREERNQRRSYERPKSRFEEERGPIRRDNRVPPKKQTKANPYKVSGMEKYRDYEFDAAIADFKKALQIDSKDIAVHFNMACAYSLLEEQQNAFFHLSRAVELGFVDFEKIKTHDALAFLRIQDEFDEFAQKGYRLSSASDSTPEAKQEDLAQTSDLLEQLNKLGSLRDKGLLTEEEFQVQKKKLLG
ncbi:MAG: NINE protein [Bacteroidota bacterium]